MGIFYHFTTIFSKLTHILVKIVPLPGTRHRENAPLGQRGRVILIKFVLICPHFQKELGPLAFKTKYLCVGYSAVGRLKNMGYKNYCNINLTWSTASFVSSPNSKSSSASSRSKSPSLSAITNFVRSFVRSR